MFCEELGRYLYSCNMNTIKVNANFLEVFYEIDDDNRVKALLIYDIGKKGKTTDLYDLEENMIGCLTASYLIGALLVMKYTW